METIEKLMWKMDRMSAMSPSAWAAALSLLSSTRRQEQGPGLDHTIHARLLDTFDAPLPISTRA